MSSASSAFLLSMLVAGLVSLRADPAAPAAGSDVFGHAEQSEAALIGVMYDLKQTTTHQVTTINPVTYYDVVSDFLKKGWDDDVLNAYYQVSRPLYTTQIFVPNMPADLAPKAFGAEKVVKPSLWVIHYKAQVSPPAPGTYRFWAKADDMICVAVNGKTELVYYLAGPSAGVWKQTDPDGVGASNGQLRPGDWFTVKAGEIVDLDVLIGECPGGWFNAFLMIQNKDTTYAKDGAGNPILPIFQVAEHQNAPLANPSLGPAFAQGAPPWKSFQ